MKTLRIFHDPGCGLCGKFKNWLEAQRKQVNVEFLPFDSPEAAIRFPNLAALHPERDMVVLADDGRWWQGPPAWIACLWTTHEYRAWSFRLASPALQPLVKKIVNLLSENRLTLSRLLRLGHDRTLATAIEAMPEASCPDGTCNLTQP